MEAQKIPILTCKKCKGFHVMMTDDGPECEDCDKSNPPDKCYLTSEVEYLIYQLTLKNDEKL